MRTLFSGIVCILILSPLCISAQAQPAANNYPLTLKTFSQSALVGMQLSVKKGLQEGKVPSSIANCVASLSNDSFNAVYDKLVAEALTLNEQETTETFFGSAVGKKYAKHGLLQIYTAVGAPLPEPLPTFSQTEMTELEAFSKTSAGGKLLLQKILQTPAASRMTKARINELLSGCERGR